QSIYNKIDLFEPFDLVMVDEVHMVPPDGEGRYQTFLNAAKAKNPNVRMVGWTATPFRTQGGLICRPENLFNEVCYEANVKDLIDAGWLSKITAKAGIANADLDHLHIRAGEFVAEDVEKAMGEDRLVATACREIVEKTKDRKACLVFCTSVEHCRKVAEQISRFSGEECAVVTGDTPSEKRDEIIRRLKGESIATDLFGGTLPPLKYCCNVSVMTTGTNIRRLDTIALLRPTASAGLYIQMVGRGFRLSPETGKTECLVLDYGKNVERFGPIDAIRITEPPSGGNREPLAKVCPQCRSLVPLSVMLCKECGYQFPRQEAERRTHEAHADNAAILSGEVTLETHDVTDVLFQVWTKRDAQPDDPHTVRVTYRCEADGGSLYDARCCNFSEWVCPEHTGYARSKFEKWWAARASSDFPMPDKAEDVCEADFMGMLRTVKRITVKRVAGKHYPEIVGYELGDFPENSPANGSDGVTEEFEDIDDLPF
ncbi:MAG: hypothetical protein IKJ89_07915, partial [Kiritimatiellae bacterium]|nr:hypothetical protein [Kiritimatiellia bacterium]